jgi:TonB family protein
MKNSWTLALIISVLFHTALVLKIPRFDVFKKKDSVSNQESKKELKMEPEDIEKIHKKQRILREKPLPLPYVENIVNRLIDNNVSPSLQKEEISRKDIKEIIFSEMPINDKALNKNPAYMSYYRSVREKIRANAYQNYNNRQKGEVVVNFLLLSDGSLKEINFNENSSPDKMLKEIAYVSIKNSSPFLPFPSELEKYSHLWFSISIYFKNN